MATVLGIRGMSAVPRWSRGLTQGRRQAWEAGAASMNHPIWTLALYVANDTANESTSTPNARGSLHTTGTKSTSLVGSRQDSWALPRATREG